MMQLKVNGKNDALPGAMTLLQLMAHYKLNPSAVIAELNGRIIKRNHWQDAVLHDGDEVELVTFVGGG